MANPIIADWGADCEGCDEFIATGEKMFFTDDGKLCENCANEADYVCDCGRFKKSDFKQCYDCAQG